MDRDVLIEKYVILKEGDKRCVAIIKDINTETKEAIFDVVRYDSLIDYENHIEKYGTFSGKILDDDFTAYEYFSDAWYDSYDID